MYKVYFKGEYQGTYEASSADYAIRLCAGEYGSNAYAVAAIYGPHYSAVKM